VSELKTKSRQAKYSSKLAQRSEIQVATQKETIERKTKTKHKKMGKNLRHRQQKTLSPFE
jgi:hypothetical protein